jgi:hypothetical protein
MELDELLEKTKTVEPAAGFSDRVMRAVAAERPSVLSFVPRAAKRFVPVAAIAAAAAIVWAVTAVRADDDASASSFDSVEAEW